MYVSDNILGSRSPLRWRDINTNTRSRESPPFAYCPVSCQSVKINLNRKKEQQNYCSNNMFYRKKLRLKKKLKKQMQREINSPMDYKHLPVSDIYLYVFRHMSIGVLESSFSKNMEKISRKKFALTFLLIKKDSSTEFFSDAFLKIFRI